MYMKGTASQEFKKADDIWNPDLLGSLYNLDSGPTLTPRTKPRHNLDFFPLLYKLLPHPRSYNSSMKTERKSLTEHSQYNFVPNKIG